MPVDQAMAARLREARERAGYSRAIEAVRVMGNVRPTTYYEHENGRRGIPRDAAIRYARLFGVLANWLLTGEGSRIVQDEDKPVAISGVVGRFGHINEDLNKSAQMPDMSDQLLAPSPPVAGEFLVYRVGPEFNSPALFEGDCIYTERPQPPDGLIGRRCVAYLKDGTKRVCCLARGAGAGLFMLLSFTGGAPIIDAEVVEAAPIVWVAYR